MHMLFLDKQLRMCPLLTICLQTLTWLRVLLTAEVISPAAAGT